MLCSRLPHGIATGLVTPATNRGFCRDNALSSVEPHRGKPEMK
jgi:hypothetical protein